MSHTSTSLKTRIISTISALSFATAATYLLYATKPAASVETNAAALDAEVISYKQQDHYQKTLTYAGIIKADNETRLAFEIAGTISTLNFRLGDSGATGSVAAELDTRTLTAQLEATRAQLEQAQAQRDLAELQFNRAAKLNASGSLSDDRYDEAKLNLASQTALLAALQAKVSATEVALSKARLVLPFDTTINQRMVSIGDVVAPGTPIYELTSKRGREAHIGVPSGVASELSLGQALRLHLKTGVVEGTLQTISDKVDLRTRTRTLRVTLPESADAVPGEIAVLNHPIQVNAKGGWLPMTALTEGNRGLWTALRVTTNETGATVTQRAAVEIIDFDGDRVFVRGTLQNGDKVVASGTHRVVPGMIIKPVETKR